MNCITSTIKNPDENARWVSSYKYCITSTKENTEESARCVQFLGSKL